MTKKFIVCVLAVIGLHFERTFGQALGGSVVRLTPTALPATCNTGDIRVNTSTNALSLCVLNAWSPLTTNPLTTLGDMLYGTAGGTFARLAGNQSAYMTIFTQTGVGTASAAPAWTNVLTAMTISGTFTGPLSGTASVAGTASFASVAGTAAAATAFTATPTACAAGVWANAIGPNGNLTCSLVTTASSAAFSSTASTSGTAAFSSTAGAINFTLLASQGGNGQITASLGAVLYGAGSNASWSILSGQTAAAVKYFQQIGAAGASAAPSWGAFIQNYTAVGATNYTALATDDFILANSSLTVTLPTAVGATHQVCIKRNTADTNVITVATTSAQTIDGSASATNDFQLHFQNEVICYMSDNANWRTARHDYPNKQYTLATTGPNSWAAQLQTATFYVTKDLIWHMRFNVSGTMSSVTAEVVTVASVTAAGAYQAIAGNCISVLASAGYARVDQSSNPFAINFAETLACTQVLFSGDVQIAGRPGIAL